MSGAQDSNELVVASHGDVYVAPVGTALPTSVGVSPNAAFHKLGLINEDGVTVTATPEIESFMSWQRRQAVRRELVNQEVQLAFALEQWNAENVILAFQGGEVSEPSPGVFRYDFPDGSEALDERSVILDWQDGTKRYRLVFERSNVMEAVEFQLVRNQLAVLPITLGVLAPETGDGSPGYLLAEDAAFHS